MAIQGTKHKTAPKGDEPAPTPQSTDGAPIEALPAPPLPAVEIAALQRKIADMEKQHKGALHMETQRADRYKADAEEARAELAAFMESPLLRVLWNGGNLAEMEKRLAKLSKACANSNTRVKGAQKITIKVESGRTGDGSVEFSINDTVTLPQDDAGACILWVNGDKLSESNAKQRSLMDVPPGKRRAEPTAEEKLQQAPKAAEPPAEE